MPNVDYPKAIPMFVAENRVFTDQNSHKYLVLHKTASGGSAQNIATFFANDPAMASTHYVVGQDGTVVQCVQEKDGAGGNCCLEAGHASFLPLGVNQNVLTISIEHVDPASDNSTPLTDAQKAASFALIKDICTRNKIPMRRGDANGGIIGHADIAPLSRARCPGNFPWDELFAYLQQEEPIVITISQVSSHFTETDANHWTSKATGKIIQYGILEAYKQYGNVALCGYSFLGHPKSNELPIEHIPQYQHLAGKGIVIQVFERGNLLYDPNHLVDSAPGMGAVYASHTYDGIGADLLAATQPQSTPTIQGIAPNVVANRLQAIGLQLNQAEKILSATQNLVTEKL